jgi:hypothetical protein
MGLRATTEQGEKGMNKKLQDILNRARARAAQAIAPPALRDSMHINGLIRARALPFETREEWSYWWLGEFDERGRMIRAPRMSEREKDRYTVAEAPNILVSSGITQVLNYVGASSGNSTAFAQYFAVGNIAINQLNSNDTSVAGEYFRAAPSLSTISGSQIDISAFVGSTQGVGSITNAGLFGNGATSTIGSGTLMTHSFFSHNKANGVAETFDYLLSYI